jgi:hypothetical protein
MRWQLESRLRDAINAQRPSWSHQCFEFISAFGGIADVAGLAIGSTRS